MDDVCPAPARIKYDAPRPIVIVLGMHRSGTSLTSNMLAALGIDMADRSFPSPFNPRGHWERPRINDLHDMILLGFGRGWEQVTHPRPLPDQWWKKPRVRQLRSHIIEYLIPKLQTSPLIGIKDPRLSRLLPLWREIFAALSLAPIFVFCVRDAIQVSRSLMVRDAMPKIFGLHRWLVYNADIALALENDPVCVLPYEEWFSDPQSTVQRLINSLPTAPASSSQARNVIDASLRHDDPHIAITPALCQNFYDAICRATTTGKLDDNAKSIARMITDHEAIIGPMLTEMQILRVSVGEQNGAIGNLEALVHSQRQQLKELSISAVT